MCIHRWIHYPHSQPSPRFQHLHRLSPITADSAICFTVYQWFCHLAKSLSISYSTRGIYSQDKSKIWLNDLSPPLTHSRVQGGGGGGGWNNMSLQHMYMSLTAVNCGTLNNPTNGQVSHTAGTTFRQTATYSCNTGHNLVGGSTQLQECGLGVHLPVAVA